MNALIDRGELRRCPMCDEFQLWVKSVTTQNIVGIPRKIEVGRCTNCDTLPCEKCGSRTINGQAAQCKHCGAGIRFRALDPGWAKTALTDENLNRWIGAES